MIPCWEVPFMASPTAVQLFPRRSSKVRAWEFSPSPSHMTTSTYDGQLIQKQTIRSVLPIQTGCKFIRVLSSGNLSPSLPPENLVPSIARTSRAFCMPCLCACNQMHLAQCLHTCWMPSQNCVFVDVRESALHVQSWLLHPPHLLPRLLPPLTCCVHFNTFTNVWIGLTYVCGAS